MTFGGPFQLITLQLERDVIFITAWAYLYHFWITMLSCDYCLGMCLFYLLITIKCLWKKKGGKDNSSVTALCISFFILNKVRIVWGGKEAISVGQYLVLPSYYIFHHKKQYFFFQLIRPMSCYDNLARKEWAEDCSLKDYEVNTVCQAPNPWAPEVLLTCGKINAIVSSELMNKAKYSFFHLPLVHRTVNKCPLASSTFTDVTFQLASEMRSLSVTLHIGSILLKTKGGAL